MPDASPDIVLHIDGVSHWFGAHRVLHEVDVRIARGQIVGLVGPSGCGKSTLLRAVLGTHPPCDGRILMNGQPVTSPGRDRGIVYQRYALFPFLTAVENVALGLMLDRTSLPFRVLRPFRWRKIRRHHLEQAAIVLERMHLGRHLKRYPSEMSGGMCQRVAIAQALIMKPEILLLDEPFGALDEATRESLQQLLLELYSENVEACTRNEPPPHTILIVTHELNEALYVSDRVLGLSQHWRWKEEGIVHPPGATIVYDVPAPVFDPGDTRDLNDLVRQRNEIRRIVMNADAPPSRDEHVRFWKEWEAGSVQGVLER